MMSLKWILSLFVILGISIRAFAAPPSDSENAYRILSNYVNRFNEPEFNFDGFLFADGRSMKRGLGPRPLRFG
uniref:Uncharacterized protein n=1 Tax=Acrobeloides nanus TaxID=290746 RepID=A0A914D6Y6_9BILA